jgi:hypothetical protein
VSRGKKSLARWWGFALVIALLAILPTRAVPAVILFGLSGLSLVWVLFLAPVWCGADTRKGQFCRNNSWGLLLGCHLRQHRWQKLQMMFVTRRWHQLNEGLWSSPAAILATISGLITIILFLVTLVQWLAGVPVGHSA